MKLEKNNGAFFDKVTVNAEKQLIEFFENGSDAGKYQVLKSREENPDRYTHVVFVTMSSLSFRLIFGLHFRLAEKKGASTALELWSKLDELRKEELFDFTKEVANVLCGSIKRYLVNLVPSLGLSTPNILQGSCAHYLKLLPVQHEARFAVASGKEEFLRYTITLCAPDELVISYCENAEQQQSGTLEFF